MQRFRQLEQLPPEERERVMRNWEHWQTMSPEERAQAREQIRQHRQQQRQERRQQRQPHQQSLPRERGERPDRGDR